MTDERTGIAASGAAAGARCNSSAEAVAEFERLQCLIASDPARVEAELQAIAQERPALLAGLLALVLGEGEV